MRSAQEELQQRLKEKEEEVRLAIEERELQKMAAVSGLDPVSYTHLTLPTTASV